MQQNRKNRHSQNPRPKRFVPVLGVSRKPIKRLHRDFFYLNDEVAINSISRRNFFENNHRERRWLQR
jgi:hypothetical protein